ncbi:hypothetical protein L218DRAFT_964193 [Marasmius fiardii PR-910]|nr:hypothetical protein L218DRAFT_964193 [Marasmius fiardii PR-910]
MLEETDEIPYLIPKIQRKIVSYLSPLDLMRYAMVNKESNTIVKDLQGTAFRVERVLSPFFSVDEVVRFRQVQFAYKFLISGSIALSFFTREVFENADLDIYIWPNYVMVLILLLQSMGYTFVPIQTNKKYQASEAQDAVEDMLHTLRRRLFSDEVWLASDDPDYDFGRELVEVFNFERNGKRIQIIAAFSPLAAVLTFHSTVVMNVISHSHAISFYPRLTFHDRIAVRNHLSRECSSETTTKYSNRGYTFSSHIDAVTALAGRYSALAAHIIRRPADVYCWTVPLEAIPDLTGLDFLPEPLFEQSWNHMYENELKMVFGVELNVFEEPKSSGYCYVKDRLTRYITESWVDEEPMNEQSWHRNILRRLAFANSKAEEMATDTSIEDSVAAEFKKAGQTIDVPREKFPHICDVQQIPWLLRVFRDLAGQGKTKVKFAFSKRKQTNDVELDIRLTIPDDIFDGGNLVFDFTSDYKVSKCLQDLACGGITLEVRTTGGLCQPLYPSHPSCLSLSDEENDLLCIFLLENSSEGR